MTPPASHPVSFRRHNARINRARRQPTSHSSCRMRAPLFALRLNELFGGTEDVITHRRPCFCSRLSFNVTSVGRRSRRTRQSPAGRHRTKHPRLADDIHADSGRVHWHVIPPLVNAMTPPASHPVSFRRHNARINAPPHTRLITKYVAGGRVQLLVRPDQGGELKPPRSQHAASSRF